jgi:hypothetical protein
MDVEEGAGRRVIGGVDTHKDLHVAAVVDERDHVLETRCFATTRQGYRQMLAWMRSFGEVQRVGIESTGSYGAGLLRFIQKAGIEVLEVTAPDRHDPAVVARTTISTLRMQRMRPLRAGAPYRPEAVTVWSSPCVSSRHVAKRRWLRGALPCR